MPPLESTILELVASGSLAEDVNPRVLQPGSWLALENVQLRKGGVFRKRDGSEPLAAWVPDGNYVVDDAFHTKPLHLGVVGDVPYGLFVSGQDGEQGLSSGQNFAPPFLAVLGDQYRWIAKDDVSPFVIRRGVGLRSHQDFLGQGMVDDGTFTTIVGVLATFDAGDMCPIVARVLSSKTGAVLVDDVVIGWVNNSFSFSLGYSIRVSKMNTQHVAVVYCGEGDADNTSSILLTRFDPQTAEFGTTVMVSSRAGTSCPSLAAALYTSANPEILVAYGDGSTLRVRKWISTSPTTGGFVLDFAQVDSEIRELEAVTHAPLGDVYVVFTVKTGEASGKTKSLALHYVYTPSAAVSLKWGVAIVDDDHPWSFLTCGFSSGLFTSVGRDPSGAISVDSLVYAHQAGLNGTQLSTERLVGSFVPAARPVAVNGKLYLPTIARGDGIGGPPYSGAIVHLRSVSPGSSHPEYGSPAALVGTYAVGEWGTPKFTVLHGVNYCAQPEGLDFSFAFPCQNGVEQSAVDICSVTVATQFWQANSTQVQGLAIFPGALTSYFDGESLCELGFLEAPSILDTETTGTGPGIEVGDYLYTAVWEYYDARGLLHYSQPSAAVKHTVSSEATVVAITVATDRIGRRDGPLDGEMRPVRLVVYRTKKNQSGPFFRLTSPTIEKNTGVTEYDDVVVNNRYLNTIVFQDTTTDAQIDERGYGYFPFDLSGNLDGRLDDDPPPPSLYALAHKSRLWLVSGDNSREVWFSKLIRDGYAPCFSSQFRIFLSDTTEEITGLAPLDDRVLIFTRSRIYAIDGDGPDDRGNGVPFREPYLFSSVVGCSMPMSIVATNDGVMWASAPRRFPGNDDVMDVAMYFVDRSLQVQRISAPIEDTLSVWNEVRAAVHLPQRGLVLWGVERRFYEGEDRVGRLAVWSYWTKQWSIWTTPTWSIASLTEWRGKILYGWTTLNHPSSEGWNEVWRLGKVFAEGGAYDPAAGGLGDGSDGVPPQWVTMRVQTPWVRPGAVTGYARTRRVHVLGEARRNSDTMLTVRVETDHREEGYTEVSFPIFSDTHRGFPLVRAEVIPAAQKGSAFRVTVSDAPREGEGYYFTGPGIDLSAISLEVAGKRGLGKLASTNRGREPALLRAWSKRARWEWGSAPSPAGSLVVPPARRSAQDWAERWGRCSTATPPSRPRRSTTTQTTRCLALETRAIGDSQAMPDPARRQRRTTRRPTPTTSAALRHGGYRWPRPRGCRGF